MSIENREIIIIPPKSSSSVFGNRNRQLRVASYSRVSTDTEEQLASFFAQKAYYTDLILRTPGWTLAGTYADEGRSGASAEKRPEFMKMYRHCKKGKIDLIITKSISRFARNTLDSISYVRKLKAMGIGVLFEKENINTLEENSEVVLTILASLAQEELNSLSVNVKMGKRMAMQEGMFFNTEAFMPTCGDMKISRSSYPKKHKSSTDFYGYLAVKAAENLPRSSIMKGPTATKNGDGSRERLLEESEE